MHLILLLFFLFANVFVLQKKSLLYAEPFFLIGIRMVIAGFLLLLFCLFYFKKDIFLIKKKKHFLLYFLLSIFGIYLTNICEIWSMTVMDSSKVCLIYNLSPFVTALLSFLFLKEHLNLKKIFSLIIGFFSFIPLSLMKNTMEQAFNAWFFFSFYDISLICAVIFSVFGIIIFKQLSNLGYSVYIINGYSMFFGGCLILLHSLIFCFYNKLSLIYNFKYFFLFTFLLCILSNLICYNLFGFLLKKYSTTFLTFFGLLTPVYTMLLGYLFLQERLSIYFIYSLCLIFIGLYLFYKSNKINYS